MSAADQRMRSKTWVTASSGLRVHTHAAAPATSGDEKLVPAAVAYPDALAQVGTATGMSSPGAARSTASERFEKNEERFCSFVAATVRTCGRLAGECWALPSRKSFPAAATRSVPDPNATSTSSARN